MPLYVLTTQKSRESLTQGRAFHRMAWDVWYKQVTEGEIKFAGVMERFFRKQIKSAMEAIRRLLKESPTLFHDSGAAKLIADIAFRPRDWDAELKETATKSLTEAVVSGYLAEKALFKFRYGLYPKAASPDEVALAALLDFDLPPDVTQAIRESVAESMSQPWWDKINDTTRREIEQAVKYNIDQQRGSRRIADDIEYRLGEGSRKRAMRIARTEYGSALNSGHQIEGRELEQAGMKVLKYWIHSNDELVRESHYAMGHPTKSPVEGADGLFNVEGVLVPYPSHVSLPPSNRVNCRCTTQHDIAEPSPDQEVVSEQTTTEPEDLGIPSEQEIRDAGDVTELSEIGKKLNVATLQHSGFPTDKAASESLATSLSIIADCQRMTPLASQMMGKQGAKLEKLSLVNDNGVVYKDVNGNLRVASGLYSSSKVRIKVAAQGPEKANLTLGEFSVDESVSGTVRHEYGHHAHYMLMKYNKKAAKEWEKIANKMPNLAQRLGVSKYATTNQRELFAESYAAWTHEAYGKSVKLPKEIHDFFMKYFGRKP